MIETYVHIAAAVIVGLMGTARLVRLWTQDEFPPVVWAREKFIRLVRGSETWSMLTECLWCASPWITGANLAWALLSDLHWSWWLFNGWLAAAYVASWLVFHDEDQLGSGSED